MAVMVPEIPIKWFECKTTHGTPIDGTFVAFKMPITGTDWDIPDVLEAFPDLKMVITLQFDMGYYQKDQFKDQQYVYCPMSSTNNKSKQIPRKKDVKKFFNAVDKILKTNPNALIGVHDVKGINRTGYMICRYLIEKRGWDPKEAMDAFENARGENMEKAGKYSKCIQDLKERTSLSD